MLQGGAAGNRSTVYRTRCSNHFWCAWVPTNGGAADATPILVARIARDVTGLDMALYRAGLKAQERCLREIEERSSGGR